MGQALSNLSSFEQSPPPPMVGVCVCVCLRRLGHGFEGLQYEVGLVDEPVCADEDIYCPGNRGEQELKSGKQTGRRRPSHLHTLTFRL